MPRIGRLHIPGGCYHLMGRGLERRAIFSADTDKRDFLVRLGENLQRSESQCMAWAIMPNHFHLLIRIGSKPPAKLMAPLLGGYAGCYNRRHQRCGYVFQNRYRSILCDADNYLLELIRYIHLNPLRSGIVSDMTALDSYPWTGHAGIMGRHRQSWHSTSEALGYFGEKPSSARRFYRNFLIAGLGITDHKHLTGGGLIRSHGGWEAIGQLRKEHIFCIGDERILGESDFVERSLAEDELAVQAKSRLKQQGWNLDKLIKIVCHFCVVGENQLFTKAHANSLSRAKSLICYWGTQALGLTSREIADRLQISQPAVSYWIRQGGRIVEAGK